MPISNLKEHLQLLEENLLTDEVRLDPNKLKNYKRALKTSDESYWDEHHMILYL